MAATTAPAPIASSYNQWLQDEDAISQNILIWREPSSVLGKVVPYSNDAGFANEKVMQTWQAVVGGLTQPRDDLITSFRGLCDLSTAMMEWKSQYPDFPKAADRKAVYSLQTKASIHARACRDGAAGTLEGITATQTRVKLYEQAVRTQIGEDTYDNLNRRWTGMRSENGPQQPAGPRGVKWLERNHWVWLAELRKNSAQRIQDGLQPLPGKITPFLNYLPPWTTLAQTIHQNASSVYDILGDRGTTPLMMNKEAYASLMKVEWDAIEASFSYFADFLGNKNEDARR